jgi:hypothetical protein
MDKKSTPAKLAKDFVESNRDLINTTGMAESYILDYVSACLVFKRRVHDQRHNAQDITTPVSPKDRAETDPHRILLEKIVQFLTSTNAEQIELVPLK